MLARAEIDRAAALDALEHGATAEDLLAWHPTGVPVADVAKLISAGMTLETWKEQRSRGPVNAAGVSGLIDEGIVPADWPSAQRLMNAGLSLSEVKQFLALDLPAMPRLKEMASRSADTQATLRAKCFGNVALALEQAPLTVPEVLRWAAAGTFDTILNDQLLGLAYAKMGLSFEQARAAAGFSIGSNDFRVAKEAGYSVDELLAFHAAGFGKPFSNTRFYLTQLGTFARAGFTAAQVVEAYPLALEVDDVRALSKAGCTAGEILDLAHAGRADAQSFEDDYLSLGLTPSEAVAEILAESF
ncbi:MAG: hypothetical protein IPJ65_27165 [Archangiaceae bacterium]|nr:hypothetical protein [Archangiaceae bacterium]